MRQTLTLEAWAGVEMVCVVDFEDGECPIFWPTERAHPGSPPSCVLESCKVKDVELIDMLSFSQVERLEELAANQLETL